MGMGFVLIRYIPVYQLLRIIGKALE